MFRKFIFLFSLMGAVAFLQAGEFIQSVNPMIGTDATGHTFPGATLPFGMVQLSPDNPEMGWNWSSGYHYSSNRIKGFSHKHLSGTGVPELGDLAFLPVDKKSLRPTLPTFSHQNESASPGYYQVVLDNGIKCELSATQRTGVHSYEFPDGVEPRLLIDLGAVVKQLGWGKQVNTGWKLAGPQAISGYCFSTGWGGSQKFFFYARFDNPFIVEKKKNGIKKRLLLKFPMGEKIMAQVGVSSVSEAGARLNYQKEAEGLSFHQIKTAAEKEWEDKLSSIKAQFNSDQEKTVFYTALYHSLIAPNLMSDVDGRYRGASGEVKLSNDFNRYSTFSLWDTFRAVHPLLFIIERDVSRDMVLSLLDFYDDKGRLPIWELECNDNMCMVANHAVPVVVEAVLKGIDGIDHDKALEAVLASVNHQEAGLGAYRQYGYIPFDKEVESVSKALEMAYDDWAVANLAKSMGQEKTADQYFQNALNYQNHFDPSDSFMKAKNSRGEWRGSFDPFMYKSISIHDYTEGNGWQYSFLVQHDPEGLKNLFGSKELFEKKLDQLFSVEANLKEGTAPDISGLIGQYAHGNEPSHHVPWYYNYTDSPEKKEAILTTILSTLYSDQPDGICGNDDCGQMSAWYVFAMLGFYPMDPVSGNYELNIPRVISAEIQIEGENSFSVSSEGGVFNLNGKAVKGKRIQWDDLIKVN